MTRRGAVLAALVVAVLLLACRPGESDEPAGAFYLEAEVVVTDAVSESPQRVIDGQTATGLRWWYRDESHYRHEFHDPDAMLEWGPRWSVADGDDLTYYDPTVGSYQRFPLGDSTGFAPYPSMSALFGPLPADTLDEFIAQWSANVDHIERVGTDEVLGRTVEVIEYGPTWHSSGAGGSPGGPSTQSDQSGGVGRFYVDVEASFILRHTVDGGPEGVSFEAEVTHLDLAPTFEDDPFSNDLPSGAVEADDPSGSCSSSAGTSPGVASLTVAGIRFTEIPQGWTASGSGSSQGSGCTVLEEWSSLVRGQGEVLIASVVAVPPTGVAAARADATPVDIAGVEGYRLTEGDIERLLWVRGDQIITLTTNAATFEELLGIAESAR